MVFPPIRHPRFTCKLNRSSPSVVDNFAGNNGRLNVQVSIQKDQVCILAHRQGALAALEAVDAGRTTMPFTTGVNQYDFIRVEELGRQIAIAAITPGFTGVINCSTGKPVSLADKVEGFIAENHLPITLEYGVFPDRPYDSPAVWGVADEILALVAAHDRDR